MIAWPGSAWRVSGQVRGGWRLKRVVVAAVIAAAGLIPFGCAAVPLPVRLQPFEEPHGVDWLRSQTLEAVPDFELEGTRELLGDEVIFGDAPFNVAVRDQTFVSALDVDFAPVSGTTQVAVRLVEYVNAAFAEPQDRGDGQQPIDVLEAANAWGGSRVVGDGVEVHLEFSRGRVRAEIVTVVSSDQGVAGEEAAAELAISVADVQYAMLLDSADLNDAETVSLANLRQVSGWSFVGVTALLLVGRSLVDLVRDRGGRDLLRALARKGARRGRVETGTRLLDISQSATSLRRRHIVRSSARAGLLLAATAGLYFGTGGLEMRYVLGLVGLIVLVWAFGVALAQRRSAKYRYGTSSGTVAAVAFAVGATLSVVLVLVGALLITVLTAVPLVDLRVNPPFILVVFAVLACIQLLRGAQGPMRLARRVTATSAREALERDDRPPVLLLRSFSDDGLMIQIHRTDAPILERLGLGGRARFEELLAWRLWSKGPVVAVGAPGTKMQPLGAARDYYTGDTWRRAVTEFARVARVIVFVVGRSEGVTWEVRQVASEGLLHKAVFIFPPVTRAEAHGRLASLLVALELPAGEVRPPDGTELVGLVLPLASSPVVLVAEARDDFTYATCIDEAVRLVEDADRVIVPSITESS